MKKMIRLIAGFSILAVSLLVSPSSAFAAGPNTALVGQSVKLSATADGTTPFSYQWQKDGVAIPGATSVDFVKDNLQVADSGTYSVVIKNSAGQTVPSLVFTVTAPVLPPTNGGIDSSVH